MAEFFLQADPVHMRDMKHLLLDLAHPEVPEVGVGGREEKKRKGVGQINILQLALVAVISIPELFLHMKSGKYLSDAILLTGRSLVFR